MPARLAEGSDGRASLDLYSMSRPEINKPLRLFEGWFIWQRNRPLTPRAVSRKFENGDRARVRVRARNKEAPWHSLAFGAALFRLTETLAV